MRREVAEDTRDYTYVFKAFIHNFEFENKLAIEMQMKQMKNQVTFACGKNKVEYERKYNLLH